MKVSRPVITPGRKAWAAWCCRSTMWRLPSATPTSSRRACASAKSCWPLPVSKLDLGDLTTLPCVFEFLITREAHASSYHLFFHPVRLVAGAGACRYHGASCFAGAARSTDQAHRLAVRGAMEPPAAAGAHLWQHVLRGCGWLERGADPYRRRPGPDRRCVAAVGGDDRSEYPSAGFSRGRHQVHPEYGSA